MNASPASTFSASPRDNERLLDSLGVNAIRHPHYDRVLKDVMTSVRWSRRDGCLTVVLGPSRAGKSHLRRETVSQLVTLHPDCAAPIVVTATPEVGAAQFSAKGLFASILIALGDPDPERHALPARIPEGLLRLGLTKSGYAIVMAIAQRLSWKPTPSALIVDEAGYIADATERGEKSVMRVLTWLAEFTHAPTVLLGTYEGLSLLDTREDVNLRLRFYHLGRYRDSVTSDKVGFHDGLVAFDAELLRLGLRDESFCLQDHPRFLYEVSHGRFGLVFILVDLGCDLAQTKGRPLALQDLMEARRHLMGNALSFGSKVLADEKKALRIVRTSATGGSARPDQKPAVAATPTTATETEATGPGHVGRRKTVRDDAFAALPNWRARGA